MSTLLISAKQLRRKLGSPDLLLIDVRSFRQYARTHIRGAVNLPLTDYHWADTSPEGIAAFTRHMQRVLSFVGVDGTKQVVFYESISGMSAARGVWLVHYLGRDRASVLDGGLNAWRAAGYPITKEPTPPQPTSFAIRPNSEVLATADEVQQALGLADVTFLDARSRREFRGHQVRAARSGCIPGARNVDWRQALTREGYFKPRGALEKLYRSAGIHREQRVVTYCQGGYRAAHAYVALKLLGFPQVRNYIGSWFEWGNTLGYPVEDPEARRVGSR